MRADLDTVVGDEVVQSFSVCGVARELVQPVADELASIAAPIVTWDAMYGAYTLTVGPVGVHKWRGVGAYCAHNGLDDGAVLAVGDGLNDIELLEAAGSRASSKDQTHASRRALTTSSPGLSAVAGHSPRLRALSEPPDNPVGRSAGAR